MNRRRCLTNLTLSLPAAASVLASTGMAVALASEHSALDFEFEAIEGHAIPLAGFGGEVVLVVNTASFCGFTPQYTALQQLHETYADRGLVVIGAPSGDFGDQEYDENGKIKEFCEVNYQITFPLTEKIHVKGANAHPFYRFAKDELGADKAPRWNFHKYLIDRRGRLVDAYPTAVRPNDPAFIAVIESLLAQSA